MLLERYDIIGSFVEKLCTSICTWNLLLGLSCNNHGQIIDFLQ